MRASGIDHRNGNQHAVTVRTRVLTALMWILSVPFPVVMVAFLWDRLDRIGNVSHWPWEEHGFLGWWVVPASFAIAAACSFARAPGRGLRGATAVLVVVSAVTFLSLFYNSDTIWDRFR